MRINRNQLGVLKGMKIASLTVLLLCLLFLLILLIFLSLSLSVSKQHNIFLSTYEFIVVKRSTRVAVFFIFNVIISTIFRGNLKHVSTEDTGNWLLLSFPHLVYEGDEATKDETTWEEEYYNEDSDVDHEYNHGYDGYEEDNDDDGGDDGFDSEDEQDKDHDLERRIEEFIAKNYRQRREELMYARDAGLHGS